MKIIVPMAGRGSRLRPHTLTTPKPLIPVAGMPIVERLVRDIAGLVEQPISDIGFVLGEPAFFGDDVVHQLSALAEDLGATPHIFRQSVPLGTGHAIMCAEPLLSGPCKAPLSIASKALQIGSKISCQTFAMRLGVVPDFQWQLLEGVNFFLGE